MACLGTPPEGYHSITPHLVLKDANAAIQFYKNAFGAEEISRIPYKQGDSRLMHAQIRIGDSMVMLADEFPEMDCYGPRQTGATPITLHLYVENVDAVMDRAALFGAQIVMPAQDMFWGDRYGRLVDPFGHSWSVATQLYSDRSQIPKELAVSRCS